MVILGAILIVFVLLVPHGLLGLLERRKPALGKTPASAPPGAP
jgi:hypothetical protein